jgi:hypothetical protein
LRWPSRHPRLALLALVLALAGAAIASALLWAQYHLRAAERAAERYAFDEAQHHLDLYLRVHPRDAAAHLLAARTARRRDAYDEAEDHLAACLRYEGMTEAAALEGRLLTAQQGDLADMEGSLQARTGADRPEAALVLEALAKGYLNRAWEADALACLDRLLERQPGHQPALLMRARIREGQAEHEADALRDYQEAVGLGPTFEARLGLAGALCRSGQPWEALSEYERLRQERADSPEVLLGLARCRYSLHEVDEARRLLDTLLARHPDDAAALLERGRLALHAGESAEAEQWLSRAVAAAAPYDCDALRSLVRCLEAGHKDEESRRYADRLREREADMLRVDLEVLQANRNPQDVAQRYQTALDLLRLGRERDGVAALFVVLEQEPRHEPARAALADHLERTGQPARAARYRRAASQGARPEAR